MRPKRIRIQNIRAIKDLSIDFPENGGLILLKGDNMTGKSTSLSLIKSILTANNKPPIGKGSVLGEFVAADGNTYTITMDTEPNITGSRYFMGIDKFKQARIRDIASLFKYNPDTVEEFISYGLTSEGRRKQRDIVVKTLGDDTYNEYIKMLSTESMIYEERRDANAVLNSLERIDESEDEIQDSLDKKIKEYNDKLEELNQIKVEGERLRAKLTAKKTWRDKFAIAKQKEQELSSIRAKKQELLNGIEIENIVVRDDGIYVRDGKLEMPLDESSVATSLLIKTVCKILLLANKETPIVLLSRLESLNTDMKRALSDFAKGNHAWIIGEQVEESVQNVVAEIFEEEQ